MNFSTVSPITSAITTTATRCVGYSRLAKTIMPGVMLLGLTLAHPAELEVRTNYHALVLYYNPHVQLDGNHVTVREAYGYRDIDVLCADYIRFLKRASGGQVVFSIVDRFELDEFPPDNDPDVTFTSENYAEYHRQGYDLFNRGGANYVEICGDPRFRIVPRVESGELDAVWVFGPDYTGFWETAMAGRDAYWINGAAYPEVNCSRRFVIYGFGSAAHQGVGFMLENTAHMTENILGHRIASGWPARHQVTGWTTMDLTNPERSPSVRSLNDWEYFTVSDAVHWDVELVAPGRSQAGLSHFPPTACFNYGWSAIRHEFDVPWESESYQTYGGDWEMGEGRFAVTGESTNRAVLYGNHDLEDESGNYRVPVIVTDADIEAGICIESTAPSAHAGLLLRGKQYDHETVTGYYLAFHPHRDRLELIRLGSQPIVLADHPMKIDPGMRYDLRVELRGSTAAVMLAPVSAPVLICSNLTDAVDGAVGFSSTDGAAWFSHLYVTPVIANYADNWRTYPALGTTTRVLTPRDWEGDGQPYGDHDYWFAWWYEHLPKNPGIHEVRDPDTDELLGRALNSWWPYIFDINTFTEPYLPTIDVLTAPPDHSAPAAPDLIGGIPTGPTSVRIEWLEPVDDIGVTRYEICRDGEWVCRTPLRGLDDTGLTPNSSYTYVVRALDGSGNVSVNSDPITVTTLSSEEGLRNGDFQIGLGSPIGWQTESFKPTSALDWELPGTGRDGSRCISIEAGSDLNDARWMQDLTGLVPNGRYLLKGWVKGEAIVLDQGATVGANLCAMGGWEHTEPSMTGTFDWTELQLYLTANSEGKLTVACRLGFWGSLAGGKAWFDDVTLIYTPILSSCVVPWGLDTGGMGTPPDGLFEVRMLAAGSSHNVALKHDGSIFAWGANWSGQCTTPEGLTNVIAVAAASSHSLALTADGRVIGWGDNMYVQCDPPSDLPNAIAIATGSRFSLALTEEGTVLAWGSNDRGETNVPDGLDRVVAVEAGHEFALALRDDGRLVAWGCFQDADEQVYPAYVPIGLEEIVGMDCGMHHAVALRADGTVTAWGENEAGQTNVPPGLTGVIAIAAGANHCLALTTSGSVVAWGGNTMDQCTVPPNVRYAYAVVASSQRSLALVDHRPPSYTIRPHRLAIEDNGLAVTIPALRGQAYFLASKYALDDLRWRLVQGVAARGSSATLTDGSVIERHRFYCVRPRL
jgi:hypothetical protein